MVNHQHRPPSPFQFIRRDRRGLTLVELMIVVAIIGILGAIGGMSYVSYVERGHLTQLQQYAMDISRAQESYFSRNHEYLDPGSQDNANTRYEVGNNVWNQLLEFDEDLPDYIWVEAEAGTDGDSCGDVCTGAPDPSDEDDTWYAVRAVNTELDTYIFYSSALDQTIEIQR